MIVIMDRSIMRLSMRKKNREVILKIERSTMVGSSKKI